MRHAVLTGNVSHLASLRLFVSSIAAPPTLNSTLGMSMERCVPLYMFCVMFSVDTTRAYVLGTCSSMRRARSMAMGLAAHSTVKT